MVQPTHTQEADSGPYRENSKPPKEQHYKLYLRIFFVGHITEQDYYIGKFPKSEVQENIDKELDKWIKFLEEPHVVKVGTMTCNTKHVTHVRAHVNETFRKNYG